MEHLEQVFWDGKPLAYIIRAEMSPQQTTFLTPSEFKQQVGFVVYPAEGRNPAPCASSSRALSCRYLGGILVGQRGRCEIDIYNDDRQLVATRANYACVQGCVFPKEKVRGDPVFLQWVLRESGGRAGCVSIPRWPIRPMSALYL